MVSNPKYFSPTQSFRLREILRFSFDTVQVDCIRQSFYSFVFTGELNVQTQLDRYGDSTRIRRPRFGAERR
jgi:hypothetical protein